MPMDPVSRSTLTAATPAADATPVAGGEPAGQPARAPFHILAKPIGPICNLDCAYCFYLDKTKLYPTTRSFKMSVEVLERFTRQYIEAQPVGAKEVSFAWQGGEPTLMGVDFFRQALRFQEQYRRPGMAISNALQTNGTKLDDEWGKFLHDHQFLIGISIDGPEDLHDYYRTYKGGRGSFGDVMRGLEVLQRHQVEYNTLTVIQQHNGDHPVRVYDFLHGLGARHMQFIPIVEPADGGGGAVSERSVRPEQFGDFLNGVFDRWRARHLGTVFVQHFEMMLGLTLGLPASLCVHAKVCGRNLAIEHNGDLYSCDHFVFPDFHQGAIHLRHLAEMVDAAPQAKFGHDKRDTLPAYCQTCSYLDVCNGGCPAHRIIATPAGEAGLNYLCAGYKRFYQHTMPYWRAMAACLQRRLPASEYARFMGPGAGASGGAPLRPSAPRPPVPSDPRAAPTANDPCPCGSGKKYKKCCARFAR